jgi:hypothetical protein
MAGKIASRTASVRQAGWHRMPPYWANGSLRTRRMRGPASTQIMAGSSATSLPDWRTVTMQSCGAPGSPRKADAQAWHQSWLWNTSELSLQAASSASQSARKASSSCKVVMQRAVSFADVWLPSRREPSRLVTSSRAEGARRLAASSNCLEMILAKMFSPYGRLQRPDAGQQSKFCTLWRFHRS